MMMGFEIFQCCSGTREDQRNRQPVFEQYRQNVMKVPHQCGVGIIFQVEDDNALMVRGFVDQGAASKSGKIREGDILKFVDGEDVSNLDPNATARLMYGDMGSQVRLGFLREPTEIDSEDETTTQIHAVEYQTTLTRTPAVPQSMHYLMDS